MTFQQFSGIVELRTKIVSLSTYSIALGYVLAIQGTVSPLVAVLTLLAALAVDMGTTGFNTYFDWYHNVDDPRFNREDAKVLIHQGVSPAHALFISLACFAIAAILGLVVGILTSPVVILAGFVCMLVGFFYSGGPRPISFTPLGEFFAGGFLGEVFFLICYYLFTKTLTPQAVLMGIPQSLTIGAILSANNSCDIQGDQRAGRKTLAILLGPQWAPWLMYGEVMGALVVLSLYCIGGLLPVWGLFAVMVGAVTIAKELVQMHRLGYSHATKGPIMGGISRVFLYQTAIYVFIFIAMIWQRK
ncbi:MAG: prenyltransferase [Treponemataceae bacterium]|nr:prenyltransferase [Treponemataceae bacterium]